MKRYGWIVIALSITAGLACESKAQKTDEEPVAKAEQVEDEKTKTGAAQPATEGAEESPKKAQADLPDAVAAIDCGAKPTPEQAGDASKTDIQDTSPLLKPSAANEQAPDVFWANLKTTQGPVVVRFDRAWSPLGVDRVYNLIDMGYYSNIAFFRVINGFMAQFGIHGDPKVNESWKSSDIKDDPAGESNTRGRVTFAMRGPNTRTVQLFINYADNSRLDSMGFTPIGEVVKCMENVDALYNGYGEGAPRGRGPDQGRMQSQGNAYLAESFPKLDYLIEATVIAPNDRE